MLREVAQFDAFRQANLTADWGQFAGQQLNQRRFTRAVATEQADAGTRHQIQFDRIENDAIAVASADLFHLQQRVWQAFRFTEAEVERVVHVRWGNQLHAFQHFDTTLRLFCFRCFSAETIDIALQMRHALLLAFVHCLLLCEAGCTLDFKRAVVAGVLEHGLLFDMNNFIYHRIEEVAIVGDQNQRALIAFQPSFQPDHRVEIEVVGGFIEQQ